MLMQGVVWKGKGYIFSKEAETSSETSPDFREVMICEMSDYIEELEDRYLREGEQRGCNNK